MCVHVINLLYAELGVTLENVLLDIDYNNCIDVERPKYLVHCSQHKSKLTGRKQFFKLARRNPVIIAERRGGQVVKTLVKPLRLAGAGFWLCIQGSLTDVCWHRRGHQPRFYNAAM